MQLDEFGTHGVPELGIQIGKRLIHEKNFRLLHHGPGQSNSLTLTAGKRRGPPVQKLRKTGHSGHFGDSPLTLCLWNFSVFQSEINVVPLKTT